MLVVALVCACGVQDESDGEIETRQGGPYAGDGDLTLYDGATTESEDCVVYDLVGTGVQASNAPGSPLVMTLAGNAITDPDGNALCQITTHPSGAAKLNANGEVLFTAVGPYVFEGQIALSGSWQQIRDANADQLVYTFSGAQILDGQVEGKYALATADTHIAAASSTRKLVLSAAIAGVCGGLGLYVDMDDY
jgi:hypothetical protein